MTIKIEMKTFKNKFVVIIESGEKVEIVVTFEYFSYGSYT